MSREDHHPDILELWRVIEEQRDREARELMALCAQDPEEYLLTPEQRRRKEQERRARDQFRRFYENDFIWTDADGF